MNKTRTTLFLALTILSSCEARSQQKADNNFDVSVATPTFRANGPKVLFDEGHNNFHTTTGLYQPFTKLMQNDGYTILVLKKEVTLKELQQANIFIIANAKSNDDENKTFAFSETECETIKQWVENGGSLLLIADHFPFGSAVQNLGDKFGINFQKGMAGDTIHYDTASGDEGQLIFSKENGLLAAHPATEGINRIITFTGQSLSCSGAHTSILTLSPSSFDLRPETKVVKDGDDTRVQVSYGNPTTASGRSQSIALSFGKGKVMVLGEAAMLTAQLSRNNKKMGMNYNPDNKKFALNIMHWLSSR